ncbi:MAG: UDP-N-acetylmuramoyl-L-alanyl-D-glutamate--2,6-diaminopimelate ligase [Candidatus Cloacimonetes bacterium]|nr:UDP-N-acetylmuramoyl-L-alanyl-D-glutamate--2,6-diaminopimelate ligase [Candidatus Cloacimonadota bacterium]
MNLAKVLKLFEKHGLLLQSQALEGIERLEGQVRVDNREIEAGDIFACIKGQAADGHDYIADARQKQAALIVCENEFTDKLPAIRVSDTRKATALLAKLYFNDPSSAFRLIGVTGTNGKTTTSMLLFKALRELGVSAGWIGTLGYYINEEQFETRHTTPDILQLNGIFAQMASRGVKTVCMEVSSHALALDRVYGIEFDYCLFTNLSREHLDFHRSMEEYGAAKLKLFADALAGRAVGLINVDDSFGRRIHDQLKAEGAYVFSLGSADADYLIRAEAGSGSWEQSRFALQCREGAINIRSRLIGRFNVANLALSAAALNLMGFEARQIEQGLNALPPVRGRFEQVPNRQGIGVFVDYAHTPDAVENVLRACRDLQPQRLLCLLGAGGDRDQGKRPLMLKAALQFADAVIITDDNPRHEDPDGIIREIVTGTDMWLPWWIIRDRREAIQAILRLARPGDIVVLCGKGHETYQEIEGTRHPFDDAATAASYMDSGAFGCRAEDELSLPVDRLTLELLCDAPAAPGSGYKKPRCYHRVSSDSRSIKPGSVFFALRGANFDGNAYLGEVLREENNLGVGSIDANGWKNYLRVDEPVLALAALCRKYLLMFPAYKTALTGSTGKSSSKELLAQVFSAGAPTLKTEANANNIIGLCQTILRVRPEHQFAVFELGTNAFGEIATLSETCGPDAGIILNIGPSHLEAFGDEDGVFHEKAALFNRPLDIRLFDADDPRFEAYSDQGKSVGYAENADFRLSEVVCDNRACSFKLNGKGWTIPYPVPFFAKSAAFAIAMGTLRGLEPEAMQSALSTPVGLGLRLQLEQHPHCLLLADCYNANPVSMQSAIEYWHTLEPERKHVAILGDMLELGAAAADYHDMIGAILGEKGFDTLLTVGELSMRYHAQDSSLQGRHFGSVDELLASNALNGLAPGGVILVKASHSIQLEKLLPRLRGER